MQGLKDSHPAAADGKRMGGNCGIICTLLSQTTIKCFLVKNWKKTRNDFWIECSAKIIRIDKQNSMYYASCDCSLLATDLKKVKY